MRAERRSSNARCRTWHDFEAVRISRHERGVDTLYIDGRWDQGPDNSLFFLASSFLLRKPIPVTTDLWKEPARGPSFNRARRPLREQSALLGKEGPQNQKRESSFLDRDSSRNSFYGLIQSQRSARVKFSFSAPTQRTAFAARRS
jgi:hypothetical protein